MITYLTQYLLQYKTVSVPGVGTIYLNAEPAHFNVADKTIEPPYYSLLLKGGEEVSGHQLHFLSDVSGKGLYEVENELAATGEQIASDLSIDGFHWKSLGILKRSEDPTPLPVPGLQTVPAQKVIRDGAVHQVLVGDQQITATNRSAALLEPSPQIRKKVVIAAWIVLGLGIAFILYLIFKGNFTVSSIGKRPGF